MSAGNILIIGSFYHHNNKYHYHSAAEQLAILLAKNNIPVITSTAQYKIFAKLVVSLYDILKSKSSFQIAIVPLFGSPLNYIWQESATRLLRLFKKKIILVVRGGSIPEQISNGEKKFFKALQRANVIVCPSAFISDFLSRYGFKARVVENVLDIGSYPYQQKKNFRPHLLWMRSFNEIYNPQMAVRVALLLSKKYPSFKMTMAGSDHGLMDETKKMIAEYGLEQQIELPGYINHQQKIQYAQECDIYINTNRIDNAPVTVVENMALGLAVVSVNVGGIPYIIKDGVNGLLVQDDNAEQMAEAIERLINNSVGTQQLCRNAYKDALLYDEKHVFQKWKMLFKELNYEISW